MNINEANYRMFEIYAREYKKSTKENNKNQLISIENKMNQISEELTQYIKKICKLDIEFNENINELPDPIKYFMENGEILEPHKYINNTIWEGFWKKCTGKDLEYFISYLEYPIIYSKHENYLENEKNLIKIFKEETGFSKIPYGIKCAQVINDKYFK